MPPSIDRALALLPAAPRRMAWRARREISRRRRRRLEAREDWSRSHPAMHDLDRILQRYLPLEGGFFVEAGALDGYFQSNTYALERQHGWRGVLVEPFPLNAAEAARERPASQVFKCALVSSAHNAPTISLKYRGPMTVVNRRLENEGAEQAWEGSRDRPQDEPEGEFTVPARTLTSVLEEAGAPQVDFMSLDVEGYEGEVLHGLDLDRFAPKLLLVETNNDALRERAVVNALRGRYREVERVTPVDVLFELTS